MQEQIAKRMKELEDEARKLDAQAKEGAMQMQNLQQQINLINQRRVEVASAYRELTGLMPSNKTGAKEGKKLKMAKEDKS